MNKILLILLNLSLSFVGFSQVNEWTWVGGSDTISVNGVYGTMGVASAANMPGSRFAGVNWTDQNGNFWLYGGMCYCNMGNRDVHNDLWKYSPSTGHWTWIKGSQMPGQYPVYGIKGVANPANHPGGRSFSASFTDNNGNLWLFGGITVNNLYYDDLWKYNISTNQWTWVSGSNVLNAHGIYGTKGNASLTNMPGARESPVCWVDNVHNNLWIFGGGGMASTGPAGTLDDLWKYNMITNQWTWVNGNDSTEGSGVYGIQGLYGSKNKPAAHRGSLGIMDTSGHLWIFGGNGKSYNYYNDLWKYDTTTNQWAWMKGDTVVNQSGIYNTKGISNPANKPPAASGGSIWIDKNNIWVFGGSRLNFPRLWNTLWKYDMTTNNWTWMKGSSTHNVRGIYGTKGVPSILNTPPPSSGNMSWKDSSGNFWFFGGIDRSFYYFNHLWKYSPGGFVTPVHLLTFTAQLKDNNALLSWQVENEQNFDGYQIEKSSNGKDFTSIGTVKAANKNEYSYTDKLTRNVKQEAYFYKLKMIDRDGSFTYSPIRQINLKQSAFRIYPNPAHDCITISGKNLKTITLADNAGRTVLTTVAENDKIVDIAVGHLPKGFYLITVTSSNGNIKSDKLVVK